MFPILLREKETKKKRNISIFLLRRFFWLSFKDPNVCFPSSLMHFPAKSKQTCCSLPLFSDNSGTNFLYLCISLFVFVYLFICICVFGLCICVFDQTNTLLSPTVFRQQKPPRLKSVSIWDKKMKFYPNKAFFKWSF